MQDGAPCYRFKVVTQFLKLKKIQVLYWPGNSPDLNPIENFKPPLKDKVSEQLASAMCRDRWYLAGVQPLIPRIAHVGWN